MSVTKIHEKFDFSMAVFEKNRKIFYFTADRCIPEC